MFVGSLSSDYFARLIDSGPLTAWLRSLGILALEAQSKLELERSAAHLRGFDVDTES